MKNMKRCGLGPLLLLSLLLPGGAVWSTPTPDVVPNAGGYYVHPTGDASIDLPNVQWAVDNVAEGAAVTLKTRSLSGVPTLLNLGNDPSSFVTVSKGLTLQGEKLGGYESFAGAESMITGYDVNGDGVPDSPAAVFDALDAATPNYGVPIYGKADRTLLTCGLGSVYQASFVFNGGQVTVRDLQFVRSGTSLWVNQAAGVSISGIYHTDVRDGAEVGGVAEIGIESMGYPEGITGDIEITSCYIHAESTLVTGFAAGFYAPSRVNLTDNVVIGTGFGIQHFNTFTPCPIAIARNRIKNTEHGYGLAMAFLNYAVVGWGGVQPESFVCENNRIIAIGDHYQFGMENLAFDKMAIRRNHITLGGSLDWGSIGIMIWGAADNRLTGNRIDGVATEGFWLTGFWNIRLRDTVVAGNDLSGFTGRTIPSGRSDPYNHGHQIEEDGSNTTISGNVFGGLSSSLPTSAVLLRGDHATVSDNDYRSSGIPGLKSSDLICVCLAETSRECLVKETGRFPFGTGGAKEQVVDLAAENGSTTNRVVGHDIDTYSSQEDMRPGIGRQLKAALMSWSQVLNATP